MKLGVLQFFGSSIRFSFANWRNSKLIILSSLAQTRKSCNFRKSDLKSAVYDWKCFWSIFYLLTTPFRLWLNIGAGLDGKIIVIPSFLTKNALHQHLHVNDFVWNSAVVSFFSFLLNFASHLNSEEMKTQKIKHCPYFRGWWKNCYYSNNWKKLCFLSDIRAK